MSPEELFRRELDDAPSAFWVDRPDGTALIGSADVVATFRVGDGVRIGGEQVSEDLWAWLDGLAEEGGTWVGYLGYGVRALTRGGPARPRPSNTPDALWMRADRLIEVEAPRAEPDRSAEGALVWMTSRDREEYLADIAVVKEHLARGESYEVCLTRTVSTTAPADPLALFLRLRTTSPTGRSVFLRHGQLAIASATPEEFLTVTADGRVSSSPIKGTAARDPDDPAADAAAALGLTTDAKTRAENLMIVDLVRNDLNRVCVPGTVTVPRFLAVESYATVHQLVSTVTGRLSPASTRVDAIRAAFPPGSMTGAPKERTMQIIDELEPQSRGVYSGVIGVLGADGSADLRVVIRTAVMRGATATIGTGGAITWASDPEEEWAETELKAWVVMAALADVRKNEAHG
ncbi:MAG: anthranilate synthase component I family protein [Nocardioides sp.]|uniref:anthranilate synthase component I family protein n=1 Tax=Nocardioides sp. TaxID=35761 RepID=UPI0039E46A0D